MCSLIQSSLEGVAIIPLLEKAIACGDYETAYKYCEVGLARYQDSKALSDLFSSKIHEINECKSFTSSSLQSQTGLGDVLVILGNEPSLKHIMNNPEYLGILRKCYTFGLNAAYRAYERFDFYPTYFGSFDYEVNESHKAAYESMVLNCKKIERYFFAKNNIFSGEVRNHPKFQIINFISASKGLSTPFPLKNRCFCLFFEPPPPHWEQMV